jgi:hypothetical protein
MAVAVGLSWGDLRRKRPCLARILLALACVFCCTNSAWNLMFIGDLRDTNISRLTVRHADDIEGSFTSHGVTRGYSLFWDSAVGTVLSDGRIEVQGVLGSLAPLRYLARYDAFDPVRSGERTAFVLTRLDHPRAMAELPMFKLSSPEILSQAVEIDVIPDPEADLEIYYFDRNPFTYPEGYDPASAWPYDQGG